MLEQHGNNEEKGTSPNRDEEEKKRGKTWHYPSCTVRITGSQGSQRLSSGQLFREISFGSLIKVVLIVSKFLKDGRRDGARGTVSLFMTGGGDVAVEAGVPRTVDTEVSNSVTLKACMAIQRMVMGEWSDRGPGRRGGPLASLEGFLKLGRLDAKGQLGRNFSGGFDTDGVLRGTRGVRGRYGDGGVSNPSLRDMHENRRGAVTARAGMPSYWVSGGGVLRRR